MDPTTTPPAGVVTPVVKPGYKTTEFWLSSAATLVGLVLASGAIPSDGPWVQVTGLITGILGALGYTVSRGNVKAAASQQ